MPINAALCAIIKADVNWQAGHAITIFPAPFSLYVGDIVSFERVNAVDRIRKELTGLRRQFVITKNLKLGERILCLYPPIAGPEYGRYQTTDSYAMRGTELKLEATAHL